MIHARVEYCAGVNEASTCLYASAFCDIFSSEQRLHE
jgi:hypothetical protein